MRVGSTCGLKGTCDSWGLRPRVSRCTKVYYCREASAWRGRGMAREGVVQLAVAVGELHRRRRSLSAGELAAVGAELHVARAGCAFVLRRRPHEHRLRNDVVGSAVVRTGSGVPPSTCTSSAIAGSRSSAASASALIRSQCPYGSASSGSLGTYSASGSCRPHAPQT
ncbi:hypothetical protein T492DRAFT_1050201 [Pavlovales sp. CCMP2436]|nr:hypothetical protein T492DRAFT_1050201 [Pavlovales sp. CCMP2436]